MGSQNTLQPHSEETEIHVAAMQTCGSSEHVRHALCSAVRHCACSALCSRVHVSAKCVLHFVRECCALLGVHLPFSDRE